MYQCLPETKNYLTVFSQEARSKSAPEILQGQESEVFQPHDLGQLAQESTHEAEKALGELKETTSLLLCKLGESVGLFRERFPVQQKPTTPPQPEHNMQTKNGEDSTGLDVTKAQHHGDLLRGKPLI
jgi:hypothetical protein